MKFFLGPRNLLESASRNCGSENRRPRRSSVYPSRCLVGKIISAGFTAGFISRSVGRSVERERERKTLPRGPREHRGHVIPVPLGDPSGRMLGHTRTPEVTRMQSRGRGAYACAHPRRRIPARRRSRHLFVTGSSSFLRRREGFESGSSSPRRVAPDALPMTVEREKKRERKGSDRNNVRDRPA